MYTNQFEGTEYVPQNHKKLEVYNWNRDCLMNIPAKDSILDVFAGR